MLNITTDKHDKLKQSKSAETFVLRLLNWNTIMGKARINKFRSISEYATILSLVYTKPARSTTNNDKQSIKSQSFRKLKVNSFTKTKRKKAITIKTEFTRIGKQILIIKIINKNGLGRLIRFKNNPKKFKILLFTNN